MREEKIIKNEKKKIVGNFVENFKVKISRNVWKHQNMIFHLNSWKSLIKYSMKRMKGFRKILNMI